MKIIAQLSRLIVGILFIISGLVKLNDPVGFSFKLEEYFSESVLNLPFFEPHALALAIILVIAEVLLGVALLLGFKKKLTLTLLFLMILFFTFLTFYSAYFNKVTDCGCFGDAIPLTPWSSFTKDVVLLVLILIIILNQKYIRPVFSCKISGIVLLITLLLCSFMGYWVLNHLPLKDFRVYKVGTNIMKGMEIPEGAAKSVYEMSFLYRVNGEEKRFTDKELGNLPADAEFISREDKMISQGFQPPIHDFTMEKDGESYLEAMMAEPKLIMIVTYNLSRADEDGLAILSDFAKTATAKGYKVIGMTASSTDEINALVQKYQLPFDYYTCDGTTLKTIERANPSIVVLENGTIVEKKHWKDASKVNLK
ncbi:BT_3928 family protein [Flavobacterium sp. NKUCC04_CG]|uniref:BT_3928 family protein n=1 Tax=Flavobacterium sp. NKUCC04_CG TaxID=2842121 RepID=UPI001C5B2460|nr:BT_3928 family protein [Flavobacterium sp. NKUCC04_CG]MBW3520215.1 DoxX family membrane protein [Flavobacterium sp. NKUCC04_CG]